MKSSTRFNPAVLIYALLLVMQVFLLPTLASAISGALAPVVAGSTPTNDIRPTWSWTSGGGTGVGVYRFHEDTDDFSGTYTQTTDTWVTAKSDLSDGDYLLYVQEQDDVGSWSVSGSFTITVDTQAPLQPVVPAAASTQNVRPTFTWTSGGSGNGIFRFHEDTDDFSKGFTVTPLESVTSHSDLPDGTYTLYVQEMDDAGNWSSSGAVTITVGAIAVTYPTGAATLDSGDNITVTWSSAASVNDYKIKYSLNNGSTWVNLATVDGNTTSASWTLPIVTAQKTGCIVQVTGRDAARKTVSKAVSAAFTINPPTPLELTSLNSGGTLYPGDTATINWDAPVAAATVKVQYTINGGANWSTIGTYTASDGTADWTVPVMSGPSANCLLKLTAKDAAGGKLSTTKSATTFAISGSVNLLSPEAGDVLAYGQATSINWATYGTDGVANKVVIKFSQDNGSSWTTLASLTGLDMTPPFPWTPEGTVDSTASKIKIQIKDSTGAVLSTDTEGVFSTVDQPISLTVSPATITENYQGLVDLTIADVSPGGEILVEQLIDADRDGLASDGDLVVRAFYVVDGEEEVNPNIPEDTDGGLVDGTIITQINLYDTYDIHHSPGQYVFRATKTKTNVAQKPFEVTAAAASQTISGTITDSSGPVPGAIIFLGRGDSHINTTLTDENGDYTIGVPEAGDYDIASWIPDGRHLTKVTDLTKVVTVSAGASVSGVNRKLKEGTYKLSGKITDAVTGEGIEGIMVDYEEKAGTVIGTTITNKKGNYTAYVSSGQFQVLTYAIDAIGLHPSSKGYEGNEEQRHKLNVTSNVSGLNFTLREALNLVSGTVRDDQGTPVSGVPIMAGDWQDDFGPHCMTVSDDQGNYTLALTSGQNWSIEPANYATWLLGYVSHTTYPYTVEAGSPTGNNLTIYPITGYVIGTVKDTAGNPIETGVDVRDNLYFDYYEGGTGLNGHYWIPVSAGTWSIDAQTEWDGYPAVSSQQISISNQETVQIDFVAGQ